MTIPALSHSLLFNVPSPYIARCDRCGRLLKTLAEVGSVCHPAPKEDDPCAH